MKKIIVGLFLVAFAGTAFAADSITMKKGVVFNHKAHQAVAGDCKKCHEKGCKGCHAEMKKGPTGCKECHK